MRTGPYPILFLPVLLVAYVVLPAGPVQALEKKMVGDMHVPRGETTEEIHTAWGNVVVDGEVEEDVASAFGSIHVNGPVGGEVAAASGNVYVDAPVEGDIEVGNGNLHLLEDARVAGRVSVGNGTIYTHPRAEVRRMQTVRMASDVDDDSPLRVFSDFIGWIVMTLGFAAAAVLTAVAAPRSLRASARSLENAPGRSLLVGIVSVPVAFAGALVLIITVVGPLLFVPAYLALVLFGILVAAYFVGRKIVLVTGRYRAGDALAAVVGALLVSAAYQIPVLGGPVFAALALLGTGAALLALLAKWRSRTPRPTYASYEEYAQARRDG